MEGMPFWAGMLLLAGCSAFIILSIWAVAWSINGSIERERRREERERADV